MRIKFHIVPGVIAGLSECAPNELVIRVQPDERIFWKITSKVPGLDFSVETRRMDLLYASDGATTSRTGARITAASEGGSGQAGDRIPTAANDAGPNIEMPGAYERPSDVALAAFGAAFMTTGAGANTGTEGVEGASELLQLPGA